MITVENLSFSYTKTTFISDMSFSVSSGEIFFQSIMSQKCGAV